MHLNESFPNCQSWLIGGVTVIAMAYNRFNTPPTSRSSTTWARYHTLACLDVLVLVVLWIVLANAPQIVQVLAPKAGLDVYLEGLDRPVYAAVLITVLASSVPPFSTFDLGLRRFFQDLAEIPWEAQRLSSALRQRTWIPHEKLEAEVREALHEAKFGDEAISFSSERTPRALWTRITVLQKYIEAWQTRRGAFSGFYFKNVDVVSGLTKSYRDLETLFRRVYPVLAQSLPPEQLDPAQQGMTETFVAAAEQLEKNLCDLVSRGVLTCGLTARSRAAEFEKIGFMVNVSPGHLFDGLVGLYVILTILYVGLMMMLHRPHAKITGFVVPASYVGAVLTAFWSKRFRWGRPENDNFPIRGYLISAVAAFCLASVTSFSLGVLISRNVGATCGLMASRYWPWSLMSSLVAAAVAYRIDQKERLGIRWRDTAFMALSCALWAIPVVFLLHDSSGLHSSVLQDPPPYWRVMIVSAVNGGVIGFLIPTLYRSPLTSSTWYEHFKIVVTTQADPEGGALAAIKVFPPGLARNPEQLPSVMAESTDDAMAEGVRSARAWINERCRPPSFKPSSAETETSIEASNTISRELFNSGRLGRISPSPSDEEASHIAQAPVLLDSVDHTDPALV
ncbi:MAG: hypothetical protein JO166_20255 [Deltaproteobacteria bacterium]|nr:hypothetical protein [Deltaproteobacteria bacterium]